MELEWDLAERLDGDLLDLVVYGKGVCALGLCVYEAR